MVIFKIFLMSGLTFFLKWTIIASLNKEFSPSFFLRDAAFLRIYSRSKGIVFYMWEETLDDLEVESQPRSLVFNLPFLKERIDHRFFRRHQQRSGPDHLDQIPFVPVLGRIP